VLARKPQGATLPWSKVSGHNDRACSQHAKQMRDHKVSATRANRMVMTRIMKAF
jgi:hypothetical protein